MTSARGLMLLRDIDSTPQPRERNVAQFRALDAFAADLTAEEASKLRRSRGVRYVEAAVERHILGGPLTAVADAFRNLHGQTIPAGLDTVHAREVWEVTRGEAVNVVVIDTGVDYQHPDIAPNWQGGFNAITQTNDPMDDNDHGTHVAGTIAARDNNLGVIGVAPNVRLWGVKALRADGGGTSAHVSAGIDWVIDQKRRLGGNWIINMSLGSVSESAFEQETITRAIGQGILIVAASGNDSTAEIPKPVSYPAAYPGVLATGAIAPNKQLASFSNQGPELAVVAPGVDVLSSVRRGGGVLSAVITLQTGYFGNALEGSGRGTVSAEFVECGIGKEGDFPASVAGRIAVIHRGEIKFHEKTRRAMTAGAKAVVIVNNTTDPLAFTLFDPDDPTTSSVEWPVVIAVTKADGARILNERGQITVTNIPDDYDSFNGTSMASPHAAGVAALAWAVAPNATATEIGSAMTSRADDLGAAGYDNAFGHGLVNALETAKMLNPAAFGLPSTPEQPPVNGRRILRRGGR